ncbi:hypothetical protein MUK42_33823, partial [Musa troglodytarum]
VGEGVDQLLHMALVLAPNLSSRVKGEEWSNMMNKQGMVCLDITPCGRGHLPAAVGFMSHFPSPPLLFLESSLIMTR